MPGGNTEDDDVGPDDVAPTSSSQEPLAYVEVSPDGRFGRVRRPPAVWQRT
jgi:hypothetical protein